MITTLFLIFAAQDVIAKEKKFFFHCPSFDQVYGSIDYCSQNPRIVEMAHKCEQDLRNQWDLANQELKAIMSLTQRPDYSRQKLEFEHTQNDYKKAIAKMSHLIKVTDANANVVASYSRALVDRPDADPASGDSSACFQKAVPQIQEVVNNLDKMIDEGLVAIAAADGLKNVAQTSDHLLLNLVQVVPVVAEPREDMVPAYTPERSGPRRSDISGIPEEMKQGVARLPASKEKEEVAKGDYLWMERLIDTTKIETGK